MKVRILRHTVVGHDNEANQPKIAEPGDVVELDVATARGFIYRGKAERYDPKADVDEEAEVEAETGIVAATVEPPEAAVLQRARGRKAG